MKVVINFKNESNMNIITEWCKKLHIEFQVIEDNNIPMGTDESASTSSTSTTGSKSSKDDFESLGTADETVGVITRYGKLVRNWEVGVDGKVGGYTTKAVRYATKMAILDYGAKWNADKKAYAFDKVATAKAFMKSQAERMKQLEKEKAGKARV